VLHFSFFSYLFDKIDFLGLFSQFDRLAEKILHILKIFRESIGKYDNNKFISSPLFAAIAA